MDKRPAAMIIMKTDMKKLILALVAFSIILLVSVQYVILNNGGVLFINTGQNNHGTALGKTVYLYEYGYITLRLGKDEPIPELYMIRNGVKAADFSSTVVQLEVLRGDIIEIDAVNVPDKVTVRVAQVDKIFSQECRNVSVGLFGEVRHY